MHPQKPPVRFIFKKHPLSMIFTYYLLLGTVASICVYIYIYLYLYVYMVYIPCTIHLHPFRFAFFVAPPPLKLQRWQAATLPFCPAPEELAPKSPWNLQAFLPKPLPTKKAYLQINSKKPIWIRFGEGTLFNLKLWGCIHTCKNHGSKVNPPVLSNP